LSGTTKDDYGEILIHQWDLCLRKGCDSPD
jgi:hypothetical protein